MPGGTQTGRVLRAGGSAAESEALPLPGHRENELLGSAVTHLTCYSCLLTYCVHLIVGSVIAV